MIGAIAYLDTLRFWHRDLDPSLASDLHARGHKVVPHRSGWSVGTLNRPTDLLLHHLHLECDPDDYFINRFDPAVDAAFASGSERDWATYLFHRQHVQLYKRADSPVRFAKERDGLKTRAKPWRIPGERVRVSDWRWSNGKQVVAYRSAYSPATGELDVLHVESRTYHRRNVLKLGVRTFVDALRYDYEEAADSNWTFYELDTLKAGKLINNLELETNRRAPWRIINHKGWIVDQDDLRGLALERRLSMQKLVDYPWPENVRRALKKCLVPTSILRLPWQ